VYIFSTSRLDFASLVNSHFHFMKQFTKLQYISEKLCKKNFSENTPKREKMALSQEYKGF